MTGLLEPHFPPEKRFPRIVSGIAIIICMVRELFRLFQRRLGLCNNYQDGVGAEKRASYREILGSAPLPTKASLALIPLISQNLLPAAPPYGGRILSICNKA